MSETQAAPQQATPSSNDSSQSTSDNVITSCSPFWPVTVHRSGSSTSVQGGLIQFSGL